MKKRKSPAGKVRWALYARVSSETQDVDLSISAQLKALRKYAAKHGWAIVREYVDDAKSARTDKRPAFKGMVEDALAGRFTKILAWKFSRFARNRRDSIIYKSLLRKNGCDIVSINEKIEDTPEGHLLEGMIEVFDQFFSENMASDIRRGMREAIERGFTVGRRIPLGYRTKRVQDGPKERKRYVIDKRRAPFVREIFRKYDAGWVVLDIAADLNRQGIKKERKGPWGKKYIYRILRNQIYIGVYTSNGEVLNEKFCSPLIDRKLFDGVQARLDAQMPEGLYHPRAAGSDYLLTGLLKCSMCGSAFKGEIAHGHGGTYQYYLCSGRSHRGICDAPRIPKAVVEKAVLDRISKHILSRDNVEKLVEILNEAIRDTIAAIKADLVMIRRQKAEASQALEKLYVKSEQSEEANTAYAPRIIDRREELEELVLRELPLVEALEQSQKQELPDRKTVRKAVTEMRGSLASDDFLKTKAFVQSLVHGMTLHPKSGRAKLTYTFPIPGLSKYWENLQLPESRRKDKGSSMRKLVAPRGIEPRSDG